MYGEGDRKLKLTEDNFGRLVQDPVVISPNVRKQILENQDKVNFLNSWIKEYGQRDMYNLKQSFYKLEQENEQLKENMIELRRDLE